MKKTEFEEALRLVGQIARDLDLFVFGSQAIHGLLEKPPRACLISAEVDIYPKNHYQAVPLIIGKFGKGSDFATRSPYYVDCVSPDLSTLPDGWSGSNRRTPAASPPGAWRFTISVSPNWPPAGRRTFVTSAPCSATNSFALKSSRAGSTICPPRRRAS